MQQPSQPAILRLRAVVSTTGLGRSTIYSLVKSGDFPRPVQLGKRSVGWRTADVQRWLDARRETSAA